jgi:hypothetical protein
MSNLSALEKKRAYDEILGSSSSDDSDMHAPTDAPTNWTLLNWNSNSQIHSTFCDSSDEDLPSETIAKPVCEPMKKIDPPNLTESRTLSERHEKKPYNSKSAEYKACQQWKRFCNWWEELRQTGAVSRRDARVLEPEVFENISLSDLDSPLEDLMFRIDHLQRAHVISLYIEQLSPTTGITHLEGGTIKGYVDAIVRKLWAVENTSQKLSSFYGNWSWKQHKAYSILSKTLADKVIEEDKRFRGQKTKCSKTSDAITAKSWKLLIAKTFAKRDQYRAKGDLDNFIKTNASLCIHIHTLFCGCRAQQEISNLITQDFKDHSPHCLEFQLSSDFKTRKLGPNFNFLDRESSFIFSEEFCDPFRIFLFRRPPNAINRFFLYSLPTARFDDQFWLSHSKPIGPKPLASSVKKEVRALIDEGLIATGTYSNTSLRKGLADILSLAHVPPVLVDLAVGHFNSKSGQTSTAFSDTPNLPTYISLWKQSITRRKIALLLYDQSLTWQDIVNEDDFHQAYKRLFPADFTQTANLAVPENVVGREQSGAFDLDFFSFDENLAASPLEMQQSKNKVQPLQQNPVQSNFDEDSFPDELFLSFLTPPELKRPTPPQQHNFAQSNSTVSYATNMAPIININGGTVNFVFGAGAGNQA